VLGNTQLIEYGIFQEDQDAIRAHVSVATGRVYVYRVHDGQQALENGNYREGQAKTGSLVTGIGKLVPPGDIPGLAIYEIPDELLLIANGLTRASTTRKGDMAIEIVKTMLKSGQIPINLSVDEITDEVMQINGLDIIVSAKVKIQVKCDWRAGPKAWGGTGNLFIQTKECNPFKRY
jgi:hypothetical protein